MSIPRRLFPGFAKGTTDLVPLLLGQCQRLINYECNLGSGTGAIFWLLQAFVKLFESLVLVHSVNSSLPHLTSRSSGSASCSRPRTIRCCRTTRTRSAASARATSATGSARPRAAGGRATASASPAATTRRTKRATASAWPPATRPPASTARRTARTARGA